MISHFFQMLVCYKVKIMISLEALDHTLILHKPHNTLVFKACIFVVFLPLSKTFCLSLDWLVVCQSQSVMAVSYLESLSLLVSFSSFSFFGGLLLLNLTLCRVLVNLLSCKGCFRCKEFYMFLSDYNI